MTIRRAAYLLMIPLIFGLGACDGDSTGPTAALVEALSGSGQTGEAGAKLPTTLVVRVVDSRGFPVSRAPITWTVTSANGSVTVIDTVTDRTGIARADWTLGNRVGTHTITASVAGLAPATFTATAAAGAPATITFNRDSLVTRNVGDTLRIAAVVTDRFGNQLTDQAVTYSSANEAIATVSSTGLVTTRGRGTTTITARRGNAVQTFRVRVAEIARLVFTPPSLTFSSIDQTQQLTVRAEDAQGVALTGVTATYSSSNPAVATVSSTGLVRAVGNGSTQIITTVDGAIGTVLVVVNQVPTTLVITPPAPAVGIGTSLQLTGTLRDATGQPITNQPVVFSSANPAIASVTAAGLVTGLTRGTVIITAQSSTLSATTEVVVTTPFSQLSAGDSHTCGLAALGALQPSAPLCWGFPLGGRLGTGTEDAALTPQVVAGGLSMSRIAAGTAHTCGLTTAGTIFCFGFNGAGQLGNGSTTDSFVPVQASSGDTFTQLSSGGSHSCAISTVNLAYCWGSHAQGQLGIGPLASVCSGFACQTTPTAVAGGFTFRNVAAGSRHTCALATASGIAYCWGSNTTGQLGSGNNTTSNVPVPVSNGISFIDIAAGDDFTCGVAADGRAYCWGRNNVGQLGNGSTLDQVIPVAVSGGMVFTQITAGGAHACARTATGQIWCWGSNLTGQLGTGTTNNAIVPVQVVAPGVNFSSLTAGREHSCGVTNTGFALCWGRNTSGQLGDGTTVSKFLPTRVQ